MKLYGYIALVFLLVVVFLPGGTAEASGDLQTLLDERTAVLWIDGEVLGDLVIGARAQAALIYVDGKLSEATWGDQMAPDWLKTQTGYYGSRETRKKKLFIIRLKTINNFTLDHSMIRIGSHVLTPADVLTNKHYVPVGDFPGGLTAGFAVGIPNAAVKGKSVSFSVGEYSKELEYPKR
ncbi:MAG: hypothetical protein PHO98_06735 [Synergistaceae bacterium]|nr:hypothetical protein [Synergistaceae bacterium]